MSRIRRIRSDLCTTTTAPALGQPPLAEYRHNSRGNVGVARLQQQRARSVTVHLPMRKISAIVMPSHVSLMADLLRELHHDRRTNLDR